MQHSTSSKSGTDGRALSTSAVGCVVIGRNEGKRLERCIESLQRQAVDPIVYVDSGSTDGSVEYARSRGVVTVALDLSRPFTMGRARNAGFRELVSCADVEYVQFVDGDCEVDDGWVAHARASLEAHPELAAVCGHLRERNPQASVYNRLFDIEFRGPFGPVDACGGVAMYRARDFAAAGGFEERMIAGEEPELCVRLRRAGRGIFRSPRPMALHDADMHTFAQWWTRAVRCGHAYADGFAIQGATPERHNLHHVVSSLIYGLLLPLVCAVGVMYGWFVSGTRAVAFAALSVLGLSWLKIAAGSYRYRRSLGDGRGDSALYAASCVLAKTPHALGVLKFVRNRLAGRPAQLIEYRRLRRRRAAEPAHQPEYEPVPGGRAPLFDNSNATLP